MRWLATEVVAVVVAAGEVAVAVEEVAADVVAGVEATLTPSATLAGERLIVLSAF